MSTVIKPRPIPRWTQKLVLQIKQNSFHFQFISHPATGKNLRVGIREMGEELRGLEESLRNTSRPRFLPDFRAEVSGGEKPAVDEAFADLQAEVLSATARGRSHRGD